MSNTKFKIGDKVEIINYGHPIWVSKWLFAMMNTLEKQFREDFWDYITDRGEIANRTSEEIDKLELDMSVKPKNLISENESYYCYDSSPEVIGQIGEIDEISNYKNINGDTINSYSLNGIIGKAAWYHEDQLKLADNEKENLE